MPGQLKVRFVDCDGGRTPAKSVLAWLEQGLEITPEQHKAPRKPYTVKARQKDSDVEVDITLASSALLATAIQYAQTGKHAINGSWAQVDVLEAVFVPIEQLLEHASPNNRVKIRTITPIINTSYGFDEPVLTKDRLFQAIIDRWEATEMTPVPTIDPLRDVETLAYKGHSQVYHAFAKHRGWSGEMFLKLYGATDKVCQANALLTYGSMWGIGKATTVGAGQFEVFEVLNA